MMHSGDTIARISESQRKRRADEALANGASTLRRVRIQRGLTLRQAADLCAINVDTLFRAEHGDPTIRDLTWKRISRALKVPEREIRG